MGDESAESLFELLALDDHIDHSVLQKKLRTLKLIRELLFDGLLDLLVNSFLGTNSCFLNLCRGRFTNATLDSGLLSRGGATSQLQVRSHN